MHGTRGPSAKGAIRSAPNRFHGEAGLRPKRDIYSAGLSCRGRYGGAFWERGTRP